MSDYDPGALWLRSMIRTGETVTALRSQGFSWREAGEHVGYDADTARRAAALFLASDYESRRTHGEAAGDAQATGGADASDVTQRTAAAAG